MRKPRLAFIVATIVSSLVAFSVPRGLSSLTPVVTVEERQTGQHVDDSRLQQQHRGTNGKNATAQSTPRTDLPSSPRNITMVVRLRGEMGNLLGGLSHAYAIKLAIERSYPDLSIQLVGQHQNAPKWKSAVENLKTCFPVFRDFEFKGGRWDEEFRDRKKQQVAWLQARNQSNGTSINDLTDIDEGCENRGLCWRETLTHLHELMQEQANKPNEALHQEPSNANVSMPFLTSSAFSVFDGLVDEYYNEIREWLRLDEAACCKARPEVDESVFHLRNFATESKNLLQKGYQELSSSATADELFANLQKGDKVAIVSRFHSNLQLYVNALKGKGLQVRVIEGQSAVQDFCFLQSAKKELVGAKMSTFVAWAGLLGDMKRLRLYAVNSTWTQRRGKAFFSHYTSGRKELRDRLSFETYHLVDR